MRTSPRIARILKWSSFGVLLAAGAAAFLLAPPAAPAELPGVDVTIIHGRSMPLAQLRGRPVLVTFWATTCGICLRERPQLAKLYRDLAPSGLDIIAVAMSYDPPSRVASVIEREDIPYPVALDIDARVERAFGGIDATPTLFLFAADGTLVYRRQGPSDFGQLRARILTLLANRGRPAGGDARA